MQHLHLNLRWGRLARIALKQRTRWKPIAAWPPFRPFYDSLRNLLSADPAAAQQLDSSQAAWEQYSKSACGAVDTFYRSGTIRASAVTSCHIQLMRSRMRDLDALYNTTLHH